MTCLAGRTLVGGRMLSAAGGWGEDEDELERRRMDSLWCAEVGRCVGRLLLKLNIVVRAADFVYEMLHLGTRGHDSEARCTTGR